MGIFIKKITDEDMYKSTYNHILGKDFEEYHLKTKVEYDPKWCNSEDRHVSNLVMDAAWTAYRKKLELLKGNIPIEENKIIDFKENKKISNEINWKPINLRIAVGVFLVALGFSEVGMVLAKDEDVSKEVTIKKEEVKLLDDLTMVASKTYKIKERRLK